MRKGRSKLLYLGHQGGLGQAGLQKVLPKDTLATTPQYPQYLAHPTPHGFSLSRVRIQVSSCSSSLSANKHPKIPAGEICPLQQRCEQEEREHVSGRERAEPQQTQLTHHSKLLRQTKGSEESGWCRAGEDEIWIRGCGEAQVSLPGVVTAFWGG